MRSSIMAVAAAALLSLAGVGAEALPAGAPASTVSPSPLLTRVAEGCGPGFARGPAGGCRRIGPVVVTRPAVIVRGPAVVVRRPGCGVRVGPIGVRTPC